MRKTLKLIVVISIIFTMMFQDMSVLVAAVMTDDGNQTQQVVEEITENNEVYEEIKDAEEEISDIETSNTVTGDDNIVYENVDAENEEINENDDTSSVEPEEFEEQIPVSIMSVSENELEMSDASKSGKLYINIDLRFPQKEANLNVYLVKKGNESVKFAPVFSKGEGNDTKLYYTFTELEPGEYILTVSGKGYVLYSQKEIIIKEHTTTELSFTNGYDMLNLNDNNVRDKYGIVQVGDVNNDESVDDIDVNALIEKIEEKSNNDSYLYDFNGDGFVDIVDLSYAAINKNGTFIGALPSYIANIVIEETEIDVPEETVLVGEATVEDILRNNENYVTLQPAGGEDISDEHPVEISLNMENQEVPTEVITIAPSIHPENNIEKGTIIVTGIVDGEEKEIECVINKTEEEQPVAKAISNRYNIAAAYRLATMANVASEVAPEGVVNFNADGTIVVNLGSKVAVKKITIKVTGTKSNKLADIAKVEFLNGMSDKIPEPELSIPSGVTADVTEEQITISWNYVPNVTGYEVLIISNGVSETHLVDGHMLTIENFNGKAIKDLLKTNGNPTEYQISVRSVNGEWFSGYSEPPVVAIPTANGVPNKPTGVSVVGAYKEVIVSWDLDPRADTYEVWYREKETGEFILAADNVTSGSYRISNLKEKTKYQAYVIAKNDHGSSPQSNIGTAETTAVLPVDMPKRNLINTSKGDGVLTDHILNVKFNKDGAKRFMVDSPLDEGQETAQGIVDNSYFSFFQVNDWDLGGWYTGEKGPTVEFDNEYKIDYITVAQAEWTGSLNFANIVYYDNNGKRGESRASQVYTRQDKDGHNYTVIKLPNPINAKKISVNVGRADMGNNKITIAEINFYYYDDLEDKINALYEDQMHVKLRSDVLLSDIEALEAKVNEVDEATGEYHPEREKLLVEINEAKNLYVNGSKMCNTIKIDDAVTAFYDNHIEFKNSGMNAWQPLGVVAHAGDTVTIYVGNEYKDVGQSTNLQLIATQYHGYASNWQTVLVKNLKVGKNVVTIPELFKFDVEKGGSLYINYTGLKDDDPFKSFEKYYGVRVEGGHEIPVLDLTKVENTEDAKMSAITEYIENVEDLMTTIADSHDDICVKAGESYGEAKYGTIGSENNETNCILGATEIVMDHIMYSVSAKQILAGLGNGNTADKAKKLYDSIEAMDDMIDLFYANKGLSESAKDAGSKNIYPRSRLNIRYMRMSGRAFMYAGGAHIGIEWPEVQLLSQGNPIVTDEFGKYESGNYFGWGIAHEIGHVINQQAYVHGEVTNNFFSVLAQAEDTNDSVRFSYPEVYKKVTSGKVGKAQNVFTQLGLYWQFHLAYDMNGYNFKKYDTYKQTLDSYVFARMDTYARDTSKAPKAEVDGVALTLTANDKDNNLMRLACAATQKNVLEFFRRWGMVPDEDTIKYASQWPDENRAIYYINDEARAYVLSGGEGMLDDTKVEATRSLGVNTNQVVITFGNNHMSENKDAILGYEIVRTYMSNDEEKSDTVAFVTADGTEEKLTYTDTIDTLNNRVFTYKITAYDKHLEKTEQYVLDPIKVSHDGTLGGKEDWVVETNLTSDSDKWVEEDPKYKADDAEILQKGIDDLIDGNYKTDYVGNKPEDEDGEIIITLEGAKRLVGFKYTSSAKKTLENYEVQVSIDGTEWTTVKSVSTGIAQKISNILSNGFDENNTQTVYFNKDGDDKLYMYDTVYVKFIIKDKEISISEIDLLGQTGDNVDLLEDAIGILDEELTLGKSDVSGNTVVIPEGSIIFTGIYKGNPAYNALKLWDQDNNLIPGVQTFYADPVEDGGELGEVVGGIWIYWIEPTIIVDENGEQIDDPEKGNEIENPIYKQFTDKTIKTVRAELYRVDNALTLENERLTSDTYRIKVPEELPSIHLNSNADIVK